MAEDRIVEFTWDGFEIADADADEAACRVVEAGGEASIPPPKDPAIAFIPIVLGAIALIGLAKAVKGFIDDLGKGVIIDARGEPVKVSKDTNLPRGVVVLISGDGSVRLDQPDHDSLKSLIEAALAARQ
ncbi:hypothetical protein ACQP0C_22195 [Nocardia sp. CA-129566]|uniref:hypothetical protein n=1 Tax=Nocardia sp. CA-129566 TaxID=3239976 RepID=UPI003D973BF3